MSNQGSSEQLSLFVKMSAPAVGRAGADIFTKYRYVRCSEFPQFLGGTLRVLLTAFWVIALVGQSEAQNVRLVDRDEFEPVLMGLVDFDDISASPLPGTLYPTRIPFRGLIADTYFVGQIPILRQNFGRPHSVNYGLPSSPLKEGGKYQQNSRLHIATTPEYGEDAFLIADAWYKTGYRPVDIYGFGVTVIKFTNRQFVFGFELKQVVFPHNGRPVAKVSFYSVEGKLLGDPVLLTAFTSYTFLVPEHAREVKGIEITNFGTIPIAIDTIVFELPLVIG